ncbi:hypothetical protein GCM10020331_082880 [Ectobacillus funiculus]
MATVLWGVFLFIGGTYIVGKKVNVLINGAAHEVEQGTRILDYLLSQEIQHPHICYSEILGPVQSCDTCMCEVNGSIMRACSTVVEAGMNILTASELAKKAQEEAMDRIFRKIIYCIVQFVIITTVIAVCIIQLN